MLKDPALFSSPCPPPPPHPTAALPPRSIIPAMQTHTPNTGGQTIGNHFLSCLSEVSSLSEFHQDKTGAVSLMAPLKAPAWSH